MEDGGIESEEKECEDDEVGDAVDNDKYYQEIIDYLSNGKTCLNTMVKNVMKIRAINYCVSRHLNL